MTEYRIVEKAAFTVIGKKRRFSMEGSYSEIPKFWQEHMSDSGFVIGDPRQEVPEGYETRQIPAGTWAVFPATVRCPRHSGT